MKQLIMERIILISIALTVFTTTVICNQHSNSSDSSPSEAINLRMGDLKLTQQQEFAIKHKLVIDSSTKTNNAAFAGASNVVKKWNNGIVPYVIDCALKNMPNALKATKEAMAEWEAKTCIRFVPRDGHKEYLKIFRNTHCWSNVGNIGVTKLSVGDGCEYRHVMVHELGHAIGFWHEQNRPDRDTYVKVLWQNIQPWVKDAFDIVQDVDSLGVKYDYESIMHYPWSAFSVNGKDTMKPRQRTKAKPYEYLSKLDVLQVSRMYNCPSNNRGRRDIDYMDEEINVRERRSTDCVNQHKSCYEWAKHGHCTTSTYVQSNCKKSCSPKCSTGCVDRNTFCPNWAKDGRCSWDPYTMKNCKLSCKDSSCAVPTATVPRTKPVTTIKPATRKPTVSGKCKDRKSTCPKLLSMCTSDSVRDACRKTCGLCIPPKPCKDIGVKKCKAWKVYCKTSKAVQRDCPITCNSCPKDVKPAKKTGVEFGKGILCIDKDNRCSEFARNGDCNKKGSFAQRKCLKSCPNSSCDRVPPKVPGSCSKPLGLSNYSPNPLPDSAFSSSSVMPSSAWSAAGNNARLHMVDDRENKRIGAWCPDTKKDKAPYVQVDLGRNRRVTSIATQGRDRYFERVSKFKVSYSSYANGSFKFIQSKGKDMVFDGNCDHFTPVLNKFTSTVYARYVRVHPVESNYPCLRIELYGC